MGMRAIQTKEKTMTNEFKTAEENAILKNINKSGRTKAVNGFRYQFEAKHLNPLKPLEEGELPAITVRIEKECPRKTTQNRVISFWWTKRTFTISLLQIQGITQTKPEDNL